MWLPALLRDGVLDYMCKSSNSGPSPDQPGHGSCVYAALPLWTLDPRVRKIVSDSYALPHFNPLPALHDSRTLLIYSFCNHVHASNKGQELTFRKLMFKLHEASMGDKLKNFDNEFAEKEVLVQVNEWVATSVIRCIARDCLNPCAVL